MRKQIVNKTTFRCLTPRLTPTRIVDYQKILFANKNLEKGRSLAEVVSGEARLKILYLLASQDSLVVSDIADILKSNPSGVSHQLAVLRKEGLVRSRKKEKTVFYSLTPSLPELVKVALGLD